MSVQFRLNETIRKSTAWLKRDIFKPVFTSPAAWCFATIWALAAIYLVAIGRRDIVVSGLCSLTILMFFCVITMGITKTEHKPKVKLSRTRQSLLLLQIAVIAFFVCITLYTSLMFHGVVQRHPIPVWSAIIGAFSRLGEQMFSDDIVVNPALAMANPAKYFLLPLPFLLLLGARFSQLGFRRGHRTWCVLALWCFVPVGLWAFQLAFGYLSFSVLIHRWLSHLLIDGFGEEFLFRGALQTRLRALLSPSWAIVIQALLFGVWHFGANYKYMAINGTTAIIASCVIGSVFGLANGIIFQRTRNLVACSIIHVVRNSL
ncbi:MAG: CPBP family intramembrane glutamic endopeptidase [Phycisphaerae bacterium]